MQEQIYLPVNWTDGMKINKMHFFAQADAFTSQLAQNTSSLLNEYSYGLLPAPGKHTAEIKFFLSMDNQQQVQLRIKQCRAITRGGHYINFPDETSFSDNTTIPPAISRLSVSFQELKAKSSLFYIVLSVNPYQRVPCGMPDLLESPPRIPYSMPAFDLSLIPQQDGGKNLTGLYQLPVGRLRIEDQQVVLDTDYIPPSSSVASHPGLLDFHAWLEQFYSKMEICTIQVVQKIMQKKQNNEMADIARKLCENISLLNAPAITRIKNSSLYQPPVCLVNNVSELARLFKNTLDCYAGTGKEEFINYCTEWCHIGKGELESSILALTNLVYDHQDINASVKIASDFTKLLARLFTSLAQLDYIGKRKDTGIFVKEQLIAVEADKPVLRRSFLAD